MDHYVPTPTTDRSAAAITQWMVEWLATEMAVPATEIDINETFDHFGIDSVRVIGMTGELQEWLDQEVDPTLAYDFPTIASFAAELARARETVHVAP